MEENNELKLYSISAAAKELTIRKVALINLIETGKIGVIELGKRRKVPHLELIQFIKSNTIKLNPKFKTYSKGIESIVKKHKHSSNDSSIDEINKVFNKIRGEQ
ncbi:MAG: helix-turn-helix domain-containing protein [Ignavibacteriae bacterium]|nr:DNA-binding protein [Ignavibacteriota bacterium]NOH00013.1 helix-turn-helix domain-containing protein [Ignavibacteriota bacterium]